MTDVAFFRSRIDRIKQLWRKALEENADPHRFAMSIACGVTVSASPVPPILGLRSFSAIGLAWLTRLNRLAAWLACHVFAGPLWVFAAMLEVKVGSWMLQRPPPIWASDATGNLKVAGSAILPWVVGGLVVSPMFGAVAYVIARPISARYQRKRKALEAAKATVEVSLEQTETPAPSNPTT